MSIELLAGLLLQDVKEWQRYSSSPEEKHIVLKNIYDTYFLKEIKTILQLPEDHKLSKLIQVLSLQIGGLINYNELATITGFNYHDLRAYLNVLCKTFITHETKPYYTNPRLELVKTPKFYFVDSGLRNVAAKNFQSTQDRGDSGMLRENFAATELLKYNLEFNFWRTKSKAEVDFIVQMDGQVIPIEVKSGLSQPKATRAFQSFLTKYQPKQAYIANSGLFAERQVQQTHVKWLPLYHLAESI